jgi:GntR family transcriptional repressor for pyruvate dehydrogenase complex
LIDVRHGVGVFVNPPEAWQVAEPLSLLLRAERKSLMHWWQMRDLLEVGIVKLAAAMATEKDLHDLSAAMDRMRSAAGNDEMVSADLDFHLAIASATGNPLIVVMMGPIMKPVRDYLLTAVRLPGRPDESIAEHEAILGAIANRDAERAVALMETHLSHVAEEIKALHGQPVP